MTREYPDEPTGGFPTPPRTATDREGRTIDIARIAEGDRDTLVEMYLEFDPADRAQGIPPTSEESIRDWLESICTDDCLNVAAWHRDHLVGHATLVADGEGAYELAIFVLQAYQGSGIGTALLRTVLGVAREAGVERVWLTVERWNTPAVRLYEKVGFERVGGESFEVEMAIRLH